MRNRCVHAPAVFALCAALAVPGFADAQFPNLGGIINSMRGQPQQPAYPQPGYGQQGYGQAYQQQQDQQEMNRNQTAGCAAGGILGGVLGNTIFKRNRFIGTALGAGAGCLVGSAIAKQLTQREQTQLAERTQDVFDSEDPRLTYYSEDSHKAVTVERGEEAERQRDYDVEALPEVTAPTESFKVVGRTYYATKVVNLRASPYTTAEVVGSFRRNEAVFVMGRTFDGRWNLIGSEGVLVGYAASNLFARTPVPISVAKTKPAAKPVLVKHEGSLAAVAPVKIHVATTTTCASARQSVGGATGLVTGCKSPNGGWNLA